ncbi:hypothetical protein [Roseibium sp. RKSG952]|uniref:hypothetical protein n=1 Tax=Roseibium sp. RKSG952 TaxID=2529384 RepID=UPI0012BC2E6E|nr:hypothetical protein [Roseibium sp. RKSG952]MTH94973.1 hypothetical protein [Roseibium sp. RKSG952]
MKYSELKKRLVAATMLVSAVSLFAPGIAADDVKIDYTQYPLESKVAELYWSDHLEQARKSYEGQASPYVYVGEFKRDEDVLTVTMLGAESVCGMTTCPIRIFNGAKKIADLDMISNMDFHAASPSGRFISDGDGVFFTGLRKQP